jgi:hypothetical protein
MSPVTRAILTTGEQPCASAVAGAAWWVAVGNPAQLFPPGEHERICAIQGPLNFPLTVYGLERSEATTAQIIQRLSEALGSHVSAETCG